MDETRLSLITCLSIRVERVVKGLFEKFARGRLHIANIDVILVFLIFFFFLIKIEKEIASEIENCKFVQIFLFVDFISRKF